jgi:hypothetical protein
MQYHKNVTSAGNRCVREIAHYRSRIKNFIFLNSSVITTYGHRLKNTRHPVRSAIDKLQIEQLVVGSVTTSESCLLYVFEFFLIRRCALFAGHG